MNNHPLSLIIDADTANEVDDLFAIVRALYDAQINLLGLCSAHFRIHDNAPVNSVAESQRINEDILRLAGRIEVSHPIGSNNWMGKAWGGEDPSDSPAVHHIINTALSMPDGERLVIVGQGAMTNVASAVKLVPKIVPKISYYLMGFRYDSSSGIWNKNDFNVRNDLNATDFLLNTIGLDLHIMTADTSKFLIFQKEDTFARLENRSALHIYLRNRWEEHCPNDIQRCMWDLALIEAILHPEFAKEEEVMTPPENVRRKIKVYTSIDASAMHQDFWNAFNNRYCTT